MNRPIETISSRRIAAGRLEVYVRQIEVNVESWREGPAARYLSGLTCASQPPKCGFIVMTRPCFSS